MIFLYTVCMEIKYSMSDISHHIGLTLIEQHMLINKNKIKVSKGRMQGKVGPVLGYNYKNVMSLLSSAGMVKVVENGKEFYVRKAYLKRLPE